MEQDEDEPLKALEPVMGDAKLATGPRIAAIALTLALKYHDINTVQEGALYQQYKLEGRNMRDLHIDMVFATAIKIEMHLLASSDRIGKLVFDAIMVDEKEAPSDDAEAATTETP